jgi:5'-deoxynucleotidase YfbR-like HD superfamily hydrolase
MHPLNILNGEFKVKSGLTFNFLSPKPEMITIEDIATGLANQSHFGGQTPKYFSIAQHCVLCLEIFGCKKQIQYPEIAMALLLHDAAEAYIGDIKKPIKILLPYFNDIEERILTQIAVKFDIDKRLFNSNIIKYHDLKAQKKEYETFYNGADYIKEYLSPQDAYSVFVSSFNFLNDLIKLKNPDEDDYN